MDSRYGDNSPVKQLQKLDEWLQEFASGDYNVADLHAVLRKRYDLAMQVSNYDLAEKSCHLLKQHDYDPDFTDNCYVDLYLATSRSMDALSLCDQLINRNPTWEKIYLLRAEAYYQMGLYKEALADLSLFLDITNGYMKQSLVFKMDYLEARIASAIGHYEIAKQRIASLSQCIEEEEQDIPSLYSRDDPAYGFLTEKARIAHQERHQAVREFINNFATLKTSVAALEEATVKAKRTLAQLAGNSATLFSSTLRNAPTTALASAHDKAMTPNLRYSFS